jgi:hypothetical protein
MTSVLSLNVYVFFARVAPMGAPYGAQLCEHRGGCEASRELVMTRERDCRRQDPRGFCIGHQLPGPISKSEVEPWRQKGRESTAGGFSS